MMSILGTAFFTECKVSYRHSIVIDCYGYRPNGLCLSQKLDTYKLRNYVIVASTVARAIFPLGRMLFMDRNRPAFGLYLATPEALILCFCARPYLQVSPSILFNS
jgi:hypothetical protein